MFGAIVTIFHLQEKKIKEENELLNKGGQQSQHNLLLLYSF